MKIEHMGLFVKDLEKMRKFYEQYFDAKAGEKYHNPKTTFQSYFLSFEDGARLEIGTRQDLKESEKVLLMGYAHLAFSLGSKEKVDKMTQRLKEAGYIVKSGPRITGDGYYESVVEDSEGNDIELTI
ncbi:MAG: VOC family protein [Lactovum sp.]